MNAGILIRIVEGKNNILVIDDEQDMCSSVKELLEYEGFCVDCVSSGDAAVGNIKAKKGYSFFIVDGFVGSENGINIAKSILNLCPAAKIIFFSGSPLPAQYHSMFHKVVHKTDLRGLQRAVS